MSQAQTQAQNISQTLIYLREKLDKKDRWWHYYNRNISDIISATLHEGDISVLFNKYCQPSEYSADMFEGLEMCYLSFRYMKCDTFEVSRIINSSNYLPINEKWTLHKDMFLLFLVDLFENVPNVELD